MNSPYLTAVCWSVSVCSLVYLVLFALGFRYDCGLLHVIIAATIAGLGMTFLWLHWFPIFCTVITMMAAERLVTIALALLTTKPAQKGKRK